MQQLLVLILLALSSVTLAAPLDYPPETQDVVFHVPPKVDTRQHSVRVSCDSTLPRKTKLEIRLVFDMTGAITVGDYVGPRQYTLRIANRRSGHCAFRLHKADVHLLRGYSLQYSIGAKLPVLNTALIAFTGKGRRTAIVGTSEPFELR